MRTLQINIYEDLGRTVLSSKIELEKANFIISKNKYSLKPNQSIFISKNCSIPKAKLRTIMMSHNLKVTKNFKEADVCFIDPSPSALARISESTSCYTIINDVEKIVDCFRYFMVDEGLDLYRLKDTDIDILENHIKEGEKIIVDYKNLNQIKRFCNIDNNDYCYDYSTYLKEGIDYECYEYFLDNKIVVYNHQDLMEILNGKDALVIEKKEYEQLKSMIESSDEDNLLLAMEMMANCDYTKSLLYLCILFENY